MSFKTLQPYKDRASPFQQEEHSRLLHAIDDSSPFSQHFTHISGSCIRFSSLRSPPHLEDRQLGNWQSTAVAPKDRFQCAVSERPGHAAVRRQTLQERAQNLGR